MLRVLPPITRNACSLLRKKYSEGMVWDVEYTDEFSSWWQTLKDGQQNDILAVVSLLVEKGPSLPFPFSSSVNGSKHAHLRELRVQSSGRPLRVFYAFDPRRTAILLLGGDKTGNDRFYQEYIPIADRLYDIYLEEIKQEGLI